MPKIVHGMYASPEYMSWQSMLRRCYNKNNKRFRFYGGRGICVCKRWRKSFLNFFNDMGRKPTKKHTLERKNNNKDYCPENCKWATYEEQNRNTSRNRYVAIKGETKLLIDWIRKSKVLKKTVETRIYKLGWGIERAINEPTQSKYRNKKPSY